MVTFKFLVNSILDYLSGGNILHIEGPNKVPYKTTKTKTSLGYKDQTLYTGRYHNYKGLFNFAGFTNIAGDPTPKGHYCYTTGGDPYHLGNKLISNTNYRNWSAEFLISGNQSDTFIAPATLNEANDEVKILNEYEKLLESKMNKENSFRLYKGLNSIQYLLSK